MPTRGSRPRRSIVPIVVSLALAGTASAAGSFDGTYKGNATPLRAGPHCILQARSGFTIEIQNNHFNRRWGDANMSIDVAADGTFHGEGATQGNHHVEPVSLIGKITGVTLEANVGAGNCAMHWSLTKS
jgi:hypothetical protein